MAALVAISLVVTGLSPIAQAQQSTPPVESTTPLESAEQPMLPTPPSAPDPAVAQAQQQPTPLQPVPMQPVPLPPPSAVAPSAPATAQPMQPDLFQETLKAETRGSGARQALYEAGAVITNIFLIPGRAITCALGATLGVAVLAATFGTQYKTAAGAFDEGCGGKWVVTGDDLKPEGSRAFEWER
jgi:hypothetical protein